MGRSDKKPADPDAIYKRDERWNFPIILGQTVGPAE
jgi:hypothetical protein